MSLYSQLTGQNPQQTQQTTQQVNPQAIASVKRMMKTLQGVNNPEQAMQNLAQQNPQISGIMQMANSAGSLKNLFYQTAKQKGIDPNAIISQLK